MSHRSIIANGVKERRLSNIPEWVCTAEAFAFAKVIDAIISEDELNSKFLADQRCAFRYCHFARR